MIKWQLPVFLDGQVLIQKKNEQPSVQQEQWKFLSTDFHITEVKRYMFRLCSFSKVVFKELSSNNFMFCSTLYKIEI